jgi:hypothetical protein
MLQNFGKGERMRRFVFRLAGAVLACALLPALAADAASTSAESADSIVSKVVQAYGGRAALASIKNQIIVVELDIGGQPATSTTTIAAPNKYMTVIEVPGLQTKISRGYDGAVAWETDSYGVVRPLTGQRATSVLCEAIDANETSLFPDRWPTKVEAQPSQTVDGKSYLVLSIEPRGCEKSTAYVDPKTYLIMRYATAGQTSAFSNFQNGPAGEKYAKSIEVTGSMGVLQGTVTSVRANVPLDPSAFAMPSAAAPRPPVAPTASPAPSVSPMGSPAPAPSS